MIKNILFDFGGVMVSKKKDSPILFVEKKYKLKQ
jgi:hypothetical protein